VLDAPGGGLRIQTIHAFAQSLLASFPAEAGLVPGFRPLEGREEQLLARSTLADLLVRAEAGGDLGFIRDMQALSHRLGEGGAESFLMDCARAAEAMAELGPREGIEPRLRRVFDLPAGDIEEAIETACCNELFDLAGLQRIGALNRAWGTKAGLERAALCEEWAAAGSAERAAMLDRLHGVWAKSDGEIRSFGKGQAPQDPDYLEMATAAFECCARLMAMRRLAKVVTCFAAGLRAGQTFAIGYSAAKRAHGVVDFDDLITGAERLLSTPGMGDWVRYKLDQATDHILVDEAQDTNERQWAIVGALAEEFMAGEGARSRHRTIFTVGDFKQAIFRFQGTNPGEFERARRYFRSAAEQARANAEELDERRLPPEFLDLSMDRSFRSSPPVLQFVDGVIGDLGHQALGLPRPPNLHASAHERRAGAVTLWDPFTVEAASDEGEERWVSDTVRAYATALAKQIAHWLRYPFEVKGKPLRPEDILILVRRRGDLASLLVARLHAEKVPVAGVDRLLLSAPLAVQDLLAAARFAVQPLDDLNLASLLVSPLFGWSQDDLYRAATNRDGAWLWPHLRDRFAETDAVKGLHALLAMADYTTPHQFLETILSGAMEGRRKLLERLGPEARDPVEELLASALDFESNATPSLQPFLDWFARGEVEIVRDPSAPLDAVRVMTVHGSKGLQAPVVILADACVDPDRARRDAVSFKLPDGPEIPLFRPRKDELAEPLKSQIEEAERLDKEEHWRLLYVALTRAEERLFIGGALGPADRNGPPPGSWYAACERALATLGAEEGEVPLWGKARRFGQAEAPARAAPPRREERVASEPAWLRAPAPVEARPPRPLAPSAIGEDDLPYPPPGPEQRAAAERGRLLHQLFERLPGVPPEARESKAEAWLRQSAGVEDEALRRGLIGDALSIIGDPAHAELFGPDALAEAPIAAVTADGTVIAGTADRLLVTPERVRVVDFKTGRNVPENAEAIPAGQLRQMAAYAAALEVVFPGRAIEAALLYTAGPRLHLIPPALLARYRPGVA
jgi:ATP-dependent helicase/nuclease subunit A